MADGTRVSQLAETVKSSQGNQKEFQKFVQDSIKATQESMKVAQESMKANHRQFQEAQKANLEMQKHLQDFHSRAVDEMQLQFKAFAKDMKKLVKFKSPILLDNQYSRDNVVFWVLEYSGGGGRNSQTRQMRVDLHSFDGENPSNWVYEAKQFFDYYQTPENQRVRLASFHMEGDALIWFYNGEDSGLFPYWGAFVRELQIRFGPRMEKCDPQHQESKKDSSCEGGENDEKIKKTEEACDRKIQENKKTDLLKEAETKSMAVILTSPNDFQNQDVGVKIRNFFCKQGSVVLGCTECVC